MVLLYTSSIGSNKMEYSSWLGGNNNNNVDDGTPSCPRCASCNTKFCYFNNYSFSQPRYFCKSCRRYWTKGGSLRNVPIGGSSRKSRPPKPSRHSSTITTLISCSRHNTHDDNSNGPESGGPRIDMALLFSKFVNHDSTTTIGDESSQESVDAPKEETRPPPFDYDDMMGGAYHQSSFWGHDYELEGLFGGGDDDFLWSDITTSFSCQPSPTTSTSIMHFPHDLDSAEDDYFFHIPPI